MEFSPLIIGTKEELKLPPKIQKWLDEHGGKELSFWFEFHRRFRYELENHPSVRFAAVQDCRGYWTASKKSEGKLRQKRLGNTDKLGAMTPYNFYRVAVELAGEDWEEKKRLSDPSWTKSKIEQLQEQSKAQYQKGLDVGHEAQKELRRELERAYQQLAELRQENEELNKQVVCFQGTLDAAKSFNGKVFQRLYEVDNRVYQRLKELEPRRTSPRAVLAIDILEELQYLLKEKS